MIRTLLVVVSVVCVATVLSEGLIFGYLWMNGTLTASSVNDVRRLLAGEQPELKTSADEDPEATPPSNDDVVLERTDRVWSLLRRQTELDTIKAMVAERAEQVQNANTAFESRKTEYQQQMQNRAAALEAESAEQARGILKKLQPADAVANLMALDLERNVLLLKGMPEKDAARILQAFLAGEDVEQLERGKKIFDAISEGQPVRQVVDDGRKQLGSPAQPPAATP